METLERVLSEHPFLDDIPERHLQLIVGCASNVRFEAGQFIFHEGEQTNTFYLIRQGKVALEIFSKLRGPITVLTLGEGEILGWSWLSPPYKGKFTARALEPTLVFAFDGEFLRTKAEEGHDLGYELLKRLVGVIASRLVAARLQIINVCQDR